MFTVFDLFRFLHIAAVIVWIGGAVTLSILNVRVRRTGDRAAMASLGQQSAVLGRTLIGPAAASAFVTGLVMIADAGIAFTTLWVLWGVIAIVFSCSSEPDRSVAPARNLRAEHRIPGPNLAVWPRSAINSAH